MLLKNYFKLFPVIPAPAIIVLGQASAGIQGLHDITGSPLSRG